MKAGAGLSHINYDEKTEMFEEEFDDEEENERFMVGASIPDQSYMKDGKNNRILDDLFRKSFNERDDMVRVSSPGPQGNRNQSYMVEQSSSFPKETNVLQSTDLVLKRKPKNLSSSDYQMKKEEKPKETDIDQSMNLI